MCGGCGGGGGRDWASAVVAGASSRSVAAVAATALCRAVGEPTRVTTSPSGWLVSSPTGAATVASTLTALWSAVPGLPSRVAAAGMPRLEELAGAPAAAGRPSEPPGVSTRGRRVVLLVGEPGAPERTWADAVVGGGDPGAVVAGVDATAEEARVLVSCASDAEASSALAALAAPGPAQRSTTTAVAARARPEHPWADDLDQLDGETVLAVLRGAPPPAGRGGAGEVVRSPGAHPAVAACWGAAALAAGRVAGRRTRLVVGAGCVVDLLDRTAVALRPLPRTPP